MTNTYLYMSDQCDGSQFSTDNHGVLYKFCSAGIEYIGIASFLFGAGKGFCQWLDWLSGRKYIVIKGCDSVSPIVNISYCAGMLVIKVVGSGVLSTVVGVTAPLSVPLIAHIAGD